MKKLKNKILNIKGVVLDKEQLQNYMEKIAVNYNIKGESNLDTYPIPRLNENFKFIEKTYNLLTEHIKNGIDIYPAGEWLLDNFYIIDEAKKIILQEIDEKKYKNLPGIIERNNKGFARIYVIAAEIVAYTDCKIDDEVLKIALLAYQRRKNLRMDEIWILSNFIQIAIIENIRGICEKIYSSQLQKYKVENIVERLVEKKEVSKQKFKLKKENYSTGNSYREIKYPFIEYMSYKLKKYGKQGIPYLNILEEQVNKLGMTISEVIKKEHYDIAMQKVLMGNCISSIREIPRINFLQLFEEINGVEEILKQDPTRTYEKMDYKTKEYYRNTIKELAQKTKISENYIAKTALKLAKNNFQKGEKQGHIGYYLISDGFEELAKKLNVKIRGINKEKKSKLYILSIYIITTIISIFLGIYMYYITNNKLVSILATILIYIPFSEIYIQILNYILMKKVKPKTIPKMDYTNKIPDEARTMVVIPTIINNVEKVKNLIHKMEIYYLANKTENLYFTLLGDCSSSKNKKEPIDEELIKTGIEEIDKLNKKYCKNENKIFNFIYRNRKWNASEKCYLGWERKRGLLCQLNEFLLEGKDEFRTNTIKENLNIKYIITLDADTNLIMNSAFELVGAISHILNTPIINERKNVVVKGHAIIQSRVGTDLEASRKNIFTKLYAGQGGTDIYTNAISDIYQDNFDEGIFTGKGIYNLKVFHKILNEEIPENTVLSHDLLEGNYLRCGLATDIILIDGYPEKYNSFITRLIRWVRGDWQLIGWLKNTITIKNGTKKTNPLNALSKFKILDNLRRSLVPISSAILLLYAVILEMLNFRTIPLVITALISLLISTILDIINYIVFKKSINPQYISAYKNITKTINGLKASIIRGILEISFLPYKAYNLLKAIIKTIYRLKISKQNLLEWITAEEAEKQSKTDLKTYYKNMWINSVVGVLLIILGIFIQKIIFILFATLFIIAPYLGWYISKEEKIKKPVETITEEDKKYIIEIGQRTWQYFKDNINKANNFLPPDNFQEDRKEKVANRTSPTNIGLALLSIISAYDLGYIKIDYALELIEKMINTIQNLQKWNGHLYNWYNTKTLEPLIPRYISTVDSGNFVGYLYTLKTFLKENETKQELIDIIDNIISSTNFKVLYDYKKRLFSIGFNIEENKQTDSYYDLLASEARQSSLIAIAKKDIDVKHWSCLSRTLTSLDKYKGLISWSGTAFEYLMPNINIKTYEGSLLDESCRFMIMSQKKYAKKLRNSLGNFRSSI